MSCARYRSENGKVRHAAGCHGRLRFSHTHLPWFVAGPGQTDVLLVITGVFLILFILMIGVLMLRLHHLPEHIAQKQQKIQYQLVATLGLLGMLTH